MQICESDTRYQYEYCWGCRARNSGTAGEAIQSDHTKKRQHETQLEGNTSKDVAGVHNASIREHLAALREAGMERRHAPSPGETRGHVAVRRSSMRWRRSGGKWTWHRWQGRGHAWGVLIEHACSGTEQEGQRGQHGQGSLSRKVAQGSVSTYAQSRGNHGTRVNRRPGTSERQWGLSGAWHLPHTASLPSAAGQRSSCSNATSSKRDQLTLTDQLTRDAAGAQHMQQSGDAAHCCGDAAHAAGSVRNYAQGRTPRSRCVRQRCSAPSGR